LGFTDCSAASSTSRKYYVASAKRVEVRFESVEDGRTLVELEVEPGTRDDYMVGGVMGGLGGGAGAGVGVALAVATAGPVALAVASGIAMGSAVFGGLCWITGYYHKKRLLDVRAEMEGILDRLELGETLQPPPSSWRRWVRRHFHGVAKELLGNPADPADPA